MWFPGGHCDDDCELLLWLRIWQAVCFVPCDAQVALTCEEKPLTLSVCSRFWSISQQLLWPRSQHLARPVDRECGVTIRESVITAERQVMQSPRAGRDHRTSPMQSGNQWLQPPDWVAQQRMRRWRMTTWQCFSWQCHMSIENHHVRVSRSRQRWGRNKDTQSFTILTRDFAGNVPTWKAFFFRKSDLSTKLHGRTTEESRLGPAFRKNPYALNHPMLGDENQNRRVFFSTFSFESNALD